MSFCSQHGGILIRPLEPTDRLSLCQAVTDSIDTVGRWMSWCHPGYSIKDADEYIALCLTNWRSGTDREFGIFDAASGELLGCTGINQINSVNHFANLGYWVRASRTGQGVASTAACLVARFAFTEMQLLRLEVVVRLENATSRRVAEKMGGQLEGTARQRLLFQGTPHDAAVYSLLPDDLQGDFALTQ
jgi:RimJ/RimL family protein N-acetyltransferase